MKKNLPPVISPDDNDLSNEFATEERVEEITMQNYHPLKGILLLVSSLLFFSCMDSTVKYLTVRYNAPLVVSIRYIIHCFLMLIVLTPSQGVKLFKTSRPWLVIFRGICLMVASLGVTSALRFMPVAEMTSTIFLAPILVILMARPFLGERIGLLGWLAAITGFSGVLLIVRPGGDINTSGIVYLLFAVLGNAVYQLLSRVLADTERTITLLFYTALVGALGFAVVLPWYWYGQAPDFFIVCLFIVIGVLGGVGHFLYTKAFRYAPASLLAPMNYTQLIWAVFLGWLVFGDIPDCLGVVGMCIVAFSGGLITLKSVNDSKK